MAYRKHQLYTAIYEMGEGGVVNLPDHCRWQVRKHMGRSQFLMPSAQGEICLILNEDYKGKTGGFWSVMSFLTLAQACELRDELIDALV